MPDHPYIIRTEDRKNYLYIHVKSKTTTRQKMLDWLAEVSLLSARARSRRILIDRDIPAIVMDPDLAAALEAVADSTLDIRMAIVNRFPEVGHDMKKILKKLGRLRPHIGIFDDVSNAEKWLVKESKHGPSNTFQ